MRSRLSEALALAAAAVILVAILFISPPVGLADGGDFNKVTRLFNFDAAAPDNDDRWFKYAFLDYKFDPAWHWWSGFPSSEMLLVAPALGINRLVSRPGAFDLRAIGAVHAAVFLVAFAFFLPLLRRATPLRRTLLTAAALLVFCDVMYVSYYNSFYMDTAALLFLLLSAVFFLRARRAQAGVFDRACFVASCLLFVTAKSQHSLAGLLIAALLVYLGRYIAAAVVAAVGIWWIVQLPPDYADMARFNVIFFQILPHSTDRSRDLAELGLDDSYLPKVGLYAYNANSGMDDPAFHRTFGERATASRLALYYLRHPATAARLIRIGLEDASAQRVRMGNYDRSAGKPPFAQSRAFSAWSAMKQAVFDGHAYRYGIYCAALCLLLPFSLLRRGGKQRRVWIAAALVLVSMTGMTLLLACLADGVDFLRHLFLFNACIDLLALAALASTTQFNE
jgi:hypothetical protein